MNILDPATGTGTFITNLINHLPEDRLEHKYRNEIYANEVAILPYYIANLNIEYTYRERTGRYLEFPNLCFVDTLDNMDWQGAGASGGAVERQAAFNLGRMSEENWIRVQEQNERTISVIIGNPPYNASATLWATAVRIASIGIPTVGSGIRMSLLEQRKKLVSMTCISASSGGRQIGLQTTELSDSLLIVDILMPSRMMVSPGYSGGVHRHIHPRSGFGCTAQS